MGKFQTIGWCLTCSNIGVTPNAIRARFADGVVLGCLFIGGERFSACKAYHNFCFLKFRVDCYTLVKNKTVTVPVSASNGFKVTENTTFELLNIVESCIDHNGAGFLTTDASRAKHNDFFVLHRFGKFGNCLGKGSERANVKVDCLFKSPDS